MDHRLEEVIFLLWHGTSSIRLHLSNSSVFKSFLCQVSSHSYLWHRSLCRLTSSLPPFRRSVEHGKFFTTPPKPFLCSGFLFNRQICYLSDVSAVPPSVYSTLSEYVDLPTSPSITGIRSNGQSEVVKEEKPKLQALIVDCLRLEEFTSHYGLGKAVETMRRLGARKNYLVSCSLFSLDMSDSRTNFVRSLIDWVRTPNFSYSMAWSMYTTLHTLLSFGLRLPLCRFSDFQRSVQRPLWSPSRRYWDVLETCSTSRGELGEGERSELGGGEETVG